MGRERSTAAAEGISLLQRGCEVIKFKGHGGKPHVALLRLSSDEEMLSWQRHGAAKLKMRMDGRDRMLKLASVTDVLIGRESTAFQRARGPRGEVHLSMSLVLETTTTGRETLDLCCADEEQMGLMLAAFRVLLAERTERAEAEARTNNPAPWGGGLPVITAPPSASALASASSGALEAEEKAMEEVAAAEEALAAPRGSAVAHAVEDNGGPPTSSQVGDAGKMDAASPTAQA